MTSRRRRRRSVGLAALVAAVMVLPGCASGPATVGPSGVDGLVIPTPSPRPGDFVAGVDNPWLPLRPGTVWVYRTSTRSGARISTVTVAHAPHQVAGIPAVEVVAVTRDRSGRVVERRRDWYAQDHAGNVWQLGQASSTEASWSAGVAGAQAGVAMLATPRVGDGYLEEKAPGVAEDRARVDSLTSAWDGPLGFRRDLLQLQESSVLDPGAVSRTYWARGVGLLAAASVRGPSRLTELVDFTAPQS